MEKCKFCQAQLEEGNSVCPVCGKDNGEAKAAPETSAAEKAVVPKQEEETVLEAPEASGPAAVAEPKEGTAPAEEQKEDVASAEEKEKAVAPAEEPKEETPSAEAEPPVVGKPGIQATPGRIALAIVAMVVLLALLVTLVVWGVDGIRKKDKDSIAAGEATSAATEISETAPETIPATIPADGNPDDVTCKGSYTVTDEEALASRNTVVSTVDGKELTNGVLQVYYWQQVQSFLSNYGAYAAYFGLDYTKPLDTQPSGTDNMTWQQLFLAQALENWHQMQAMGLEAEKAGFPMSQENQASLDGLQASLEETAAQYSVTLEELLKESFGPGVLLEDFRKHQEEWYQGVPYYLDECEKLAPTEQEIEDFFALHEEEYASHNITKDGQLVDVRHILILPEGGTADDSGNVSYTDEEWQVCQDKAEEVLKAWEAGEKTEESFAALAGTHSGDGGSNQNGGLYENVTPGQMVEEFDAWCFDESRKPGDTGLVKTMFGYHIMYFSDSRPQWSYYAREDWKTEQSNTLLENMMKKHPLTVSYDKIVLGLVPLY